MSTEQQKKPQASRCLVTGGAGFLGSHIVQALLEKGHEVVSFDQVAPAFSHENLSVIQGDIRNEDTVDKACEGVETVFHTAAIICLLGGSAVSDAYRQRAYEINVEGTKKLLNACKKHKVTRFVYTSSNNVTFNGLPISNMDQSTPYATRVYDLYTETKIAAERYVLSQNGEGGVMTCALRPGGIYGPDSNYMLDTLVEQLRGNRVVATIGGLNAIQDVTYIDNLVHAQLLAAEALGEDSPVCGKAYFITDDEPMNNFLFFKPIIEGLGYRFPKFHIPASLLILVSTLWQWLHFKLKFPEPMLCPKEIDKVAVTHFASMKDARRDLGYEPVISTKEALKRCIVYCRGKLA